jgi:hypothetical protein
MLEGNTNFIPFGIEPSSTIHRRLDGGFQFFLYFTKQEISTQLTGSANAILRSFRCESNRSQASEPRKKPNILVIFGDDIDYWNIGAYNWAMMGYETPNVGRIAREGMQPKANPTATTAEYRKNGIQKGV